MADLNEDVIDISDLHNENDAPTPAGDGSQINLSTTQRNEPSNDDDVDVPGIERFLAQFNIEGGKIAFEDGVEKHFSELTNEEQFDVLTSLANQVRPAIEQEYDLDEEEIGLLNSIRQSGKSVNEALNDILNERIQTLQAIDNSLTENYEQMGDDSIYVLWLRSVNPDATPEELEADLETARRTKTYANQVNSIRQGFINNQKAIIEQQQREAYQAQYQEIEQDREQIVNAVQNLDVIAGWQLDDAMKNEVLADILEVNEMGDSLLLEKTFSDPVLLFKTAWFSKYGEDYIAQMQDHYKQEITKSYRKGYEEARNGLPSRPISGTKTEAATPKKSSTIVEDLPEMSVVDDLFED